MRGERWLLVAQLVHTPEGVREVRYPVAQERPAPRCPAGGRIERDGRGEWATVYRPLNPGENLATAPTVAGVEGYLNLVPIAVYMLAGPKRPAPGDNRRS